MWHNVEKQMENAQQHYKHHHNIQVGEQTFSRAGHFENVDHSPLLTSAADRMAVKAY